MAQIVILYHLFRTSQFSQVISARKGEFETGFERGGQTREHAMLVKTAGVKHLVVLINKMDDPTVNWEEARLSKNYILFWLSWAPFDLKFSHHRYNYCKDNLCPYLKKVGFNPAKDLKFMPCSGMTGAGLLDPVGDLAPWYKWVELEYIHQTFFFLLMQPWIYF